MHTYHIHINGLVQGVGFRPFVCRLAETMQITGWVSNTNNGVHIECNASPQNAQAFYNTIVHAPPCNAIITHHHFQEIVAKDFTSFTIRQSSHQTKPDLLLTPDIGLCEDCRNELLTASNKRHQYPFTTCLNCGPRYSIITTLPYDRENTTMASLQMCEACLDEYNDISNRRHYSQTNSCKDCAIPMKLYSSPVVCTSTDGDEILKIAVSALKQGKIIAVKGIGGYLLLCDATNEQTIPFLRSRKLRAAKPFALLYANIEMAGGDVDLTNFETAALHDKAAPIVLCRLKPVSSNGICKEAIAPGLDKIGLMLAYTPLLLLISTAFGKPLIATSGNINGSPILYKDADALENLFELADLVLSYERDIVVPQDDSVMHFSSNGQKIILRRSRGLAPNYFPNPFKKNRLSILAMGGELKASFALLDQKNLYISQYLGNQDSFESQTSYKETLEHITMLVKATPAQILIDKHPNYFVSQYGKELAAGKNIKLHAVQHHKAHFGAVLAENNLLETDERVLGIIWDGTGYGDDGQIWGGEIFIYEHDEMERVAWLDYFPQLLGDKMSREPRLAALALLHKFPDHQYLLQDHFSAQQWKYYQQLLNQPHSLFTSSMGRFLDGIAAILGICMYNSYEGEAAMRLEAIARTCTNKSTGYYPIYLMQSRLCWNGFLRALLEDLQQEKDIAFIARKVFVSLATRVIQLGDHYKIDAIAFSGGVFQNAFLVDLLIEQAVDKRLYFHQQLSPNDECIGLGQLACFSLLNKNKKDSIAIQEDSFQPQFQFTT